MTISVQSFTNLVENMVASVQGVCSTLIDFTIGSILRSLIEAIAGVTLFLQSQALQVAALTRAATAEASDLDSWNADFNFSRLPAQQAQGTLTFSSFTYTSQRIIPVGSTVQTFDGSQQYIVIADTTNSAYNAGLSAFVIPAGTQTLNVLAQSVNAGTAANVSANTITQITSAIPGVDTVNNPASFAGGADPESDVAFRTRFVAYIGSLSKATKAAVGYAITTVQEGLSYTLVENQTYAGTTAYGYFYVVVDDGSGYPSGSLLSSVSTAIDAVRPVGTYFTVYAPVVVTANVAMTLTTTGTHSVAVTAVTNALTSYINSLADGAPLPYSRLSQVAYSASTQVTNVTGVTLNGGTSDLAINPQSVAKAGTISVS